MTQVKFDRKLVLSDGTEYRGHGFGGSGDRVFDLICNTSMVGYQEIASDPTYAGLGVIMTYPIIGSCGMADDDFEARSLRLGALIVREYNDYPSNFRCTKTLADSLEENGVPGISGVDTRALSRLIRAGRVRAVLTDAETPTADAVKMLAEAPESTVSAADVSCRKRWYSRTANHRFRVAVIDCGVRYSFIRKLGELGCNVIALPCTVTAEEVAALAPDGVFLSNGPGSPEDAACVAELARKIRGTVPILGVGLGHEALAMAYGAKTVRLKCGHHGGNVPVRFAGTGRIISTDQRHDYAVDADSVAGTGLEITHTNLIDGTVEGLMCRRDRAFSVQFHPEASDSSESAFGRFIEFMREAKENG